MYNNLKQYTLQIINGSASYTVYEEALDFDVDFECYKFFIKDNKNNKIIISIYPVNRTIISKIRNV